MRCRYFNDVFPGTNYRLTDLSMSYDTLNKTNKALLFTHKYIDIDCRVADGITILVLCCSYSDSNSNTEEICKVKESEKSLVYFKSADWKLIGNQSVTSSGGEVQNQYILCHLYYN